jgi:predicted nucleic acid-binding protein
MARVRYMLDTNILSEPVVTRPNRLVLERIKANTRAIALCGLRPEDQLGAVIVIERSAQFTPAQAVF